MYFTGRNILANKIKVLRVISRMNLGGPAIQILGLMENMSRNKFDHKLLTGYCEANEIDYLQLNSGKTEFSYVVGLGRGINIFSDIRAFLEIRRRIRCFMPDIVHTHTAKAGFLGRIAAISVSKRFKLVHTYHGHLLYGYFGSLQTFILIRIERLLARFTSVLITVGSQICEDLLDVGIGKADQYVVFPPGVKVPCLPSKNFLLSTLKIPSDYFVIAWIGRVEPIKSPTRIIEIAEECQRRKLKVHFVVAGAGSMLMELVNESQNLNLPITFLGWHLDVESLLGCSNLVLLTSENEGTPLALIQAQLAGVPVLSTDVGSAHEVLLNEESGFCLTYSKEAFVNKIQYLIDNPIICSEFGSVGKNFATENFSVERLVLRHEELYEELFNQSKSSPRSPT